MRFIFYLVHTISMKKQSKEYKQILSKLTNCEPNEVGEILKEYFNARKNKN